MSSRLQVPKAVERCYRRVVMARVVLGDKYDSLSKAQQNTTRGWLMYAKMDALDGYIDSLINTLGICERDTRRIGREVMQARPAQASAAL